MDTPILDRRAALPPRSAPGSGLSVVLILSGIVAWFRTRAQAAILEANGDAAGALLKLAEVETAIAAWPRNPQREMALRLVRRWKAELL